MSNTDVEGIIINSRRINQRIKISEQSTQINEYTTLFIVPQKVLVSYMFAVLSNKDFWKDFFLYLIKFYLVLV